MTLRYLATALLLGTAAAPAAANINLVADSGWHSDTISAVGVPSNGGAIDFTVVSGSARFSLTDGLIAGDIYKIRVIGGLSEFTDFTLQPTPFDSSTGPAAIDFSIPWLNPAYSRLQVVFGGPGSYSIVVTGDCARTCPADFGFRLDTVAPMVGVPEPASWALLIAGFGLTGAAARRRRSGLPIVAA